MIVIVATLLAMISAIAIASAAETLFYSYDSMGRLIQVTYVDGTVVQYSYDKMGNRLQKTAVIGSASCTYTLSQTGKAFSSASGSGSLNITASSGSCNWQAAVHPASAGWLSIIQPGGTGSGPVNYSVSANSACPPRTGTMAIAGHTFTVTQSGSCMLTVNKTGGVNGTVMSVPGGIACGAQCTGPFESGSVVTLTAQVPVGASFRSWNGCDEPSDMSCKLTIDTAREVTADFAACTNLAVTTHPQQGTDGQYPSLVQAYADTYEISLIKVQAVRLTDDLALGRAGTYTIKGGYDCNFQNSWLGTTLSGTVTISNGSVSMDNLILTGTTTVNGSGSLTVEKLILQ